MPERIQAIRGMNDVLPEACGKWQLVEQSLRGCLARYGYQEIRFPIVESTQLFKRTLGEITDIVEKEMYTFSDLNGDSLTLRPEGTAGCVRACLEHGLLHNQQQKLWYTGPMFRHERPQKGRYRQFTHLGVEAFGLSGTAIELELILICRRFWAMLGLEKLVQLQINTLGELSERQRYKERLVGYLKDYFERLDEDSKRRLDKNPLRVLDSKNPEMQEIIKKAPKLLDSLGKQSRTHFDALCLGLEACNIPYTINPFLVRGLDYYGHTVFEWVTDKLGSQSTVCAGGRYDLLLEQLSGSPSPAVGFALGLERLMILMETLDFEKKKNQDKSVFMMASNDLALTQALILAESLRTAHPEVLVYTNTVLSSFKSQFKKANKNGARLALILGDGEMQKQQVSIKDLRQEVEQITIAQNQLNDFVFNYLACAVTDL